MNSIQSSILLLYALSVALMVIYPPYYIEMQGAIIQSGYSWIWEPITYLSKSGIQGKIDLAKLGAQLLGATLIAVALFLAGNKKKT